MGFGWMGLGLMFELDRAFLALCVAVEGVEGGGL